MSAPSPRTIQKHYLLLTFLSTLSASFIWGINTLFLLQAGMSNTQAFATNAFFTLGQVIFEVPTGIVADTWGRRASFLTGSAVLAVSTLAYYFLGIHAQPFVWWALVSILLGLGFTFFSGAMEAWLVDALEHSGFDGKIEDVFAKGQIANGTAMLLGASLGGWLAQVTDLSVPYLVRAAVLGASFFTAFIVMKDWGFVPEAHASLSMRLRSTFRASIAGGLKVPSVRWMMLVSPALSGVTIYGFYAAQPYLLSLYENPRAYQVAGLAAALAAGSQIIGGLLAPRISRAFARRSVAVGTLIGMSSVALGLAGLTSSFYLAATFIGVWSLLTAAIFPIRQAYLNHGIKSSQRATILSFDGLMGSMGGVFTQPALGKTADVFGYAVSFVISAVIQILALPFVYLAYRCAAAADSTRR